MGSSITPLLTRLVQRNGRVTIFAVVIAAALHAVALLALKNSLRPQPGNPQPEHRALTVTFIPAETRRSGTAPSNDTIHISRATKQSRSRAATNPSSVQQLRERETTSVPRQDVSTPVAIPADTSGVSKSPDESIDWQRDLQTIDTLRSAQYGTTPQPASREPHNHTQEVTTLLDREISKTARSDCRNKYSRMGLLAIPMLAVDAMNRDGCQW